MYTCMYVRERIFSIIYLQLNHQQINGINAIFYQNKKKVHETN